MAHKEPGLLNSMKNPVVVIDAQKRVVFANAAAEQLLPLRAGQGCPGAAGCPLSGGGACCLERCAHGETALELPLPGGRTLLAQMSALPASLYGAGAVVCVMADITPLKKAAQELEQRAARYRSAMSETNSYLWDYDIPGRTLYQSAYQAELLREDCILPTMQRGIPEALVTGNIVHPDSAEDLYAMFRGIHAGERKCGCTVQLIHPRQRENHWLEFTASTVFDSAGNPIRALLAARDVTDRKRLEERFNQELLLRASLTANAISEYEANLTRDTMTSVPPSWRTLTGLPEPKAYSELLRLMAQFLPSAQEREQLAERLSREALMTAFQDGRLCVQAECRAAVRGRPPFWVNVTAHLLSAPDGDIRTLLCISDIDAQKQRELALLEQAQRDPLTGLLNRRACEERITRALAAAPDSLFALLMLDVDDFKSINDTYGHLFGDAVLTSIAQRLSGLFRKNDLICRLGGDEFLVFLQNIPYDQVAFNKAEQIGHTLQNAVAFGGKSCVVSCSIGIAFAPGHAREFRELYRKADAALYRAKRMGKTCYTVYQEEEPVTL